ncbi:hepatitis A virus cellular receptor 1 homolog isoform X2 [Mastacembelus armatus]|uniref:hepatitis A virus cellular receptor 1 homolog isoform X2 n=1 Tax=Mastacembelus armatus TaxID=205130 RepID=UPI000E464F0F|nr:hepatitis A virus cellular receptor 1 homolog isoform X2 [Mastacembelus armatus]
MTLSSTVHSHEVGVIGLIGHNVTLPCTFDSETYGVLSFCWGRGKLPWSKCSDTIVSSQDGNVEFRESSRYQLLGKTDGDVSLTILNAHLSDTGVYGCRVEIPGLFNDYKVNIQLVMAEAPVEPITQDCTLPPVVRQAEHTEISTCAPTSLEVGDPKLDETESLITEQKLTEFFEMENIIRMGAVFLSSLIVILILIIWRRLCPKKKLQHFNTSAPENIYESVPVAV